MWEFDHREGWEPKNWCFQTGVLEKTLEGPLDSKEIRLVNPERNQPWNSLEGLMLKLQYCDHLRRRANSLEETLMLGGIEGRRRDDRGWDGWMASLTRWTWVWANSGREWSQGSLACCSPWGCKEWDTTYWLSNKMTVDKGKSPKLIEKLLKLMTNFRSCLSLAPHNQIASSGWLKQ